MPPRREGAAARALSDPSHVLRHLDGKGGPHPVGADGRHDLHVDRRIAELARTQRNLISIGQLRALGVTRGEWERRVRSGHLHPQHRGVFAVGTPLLPPLGRERAALLAVPGSALTRGSAGAVLGVLPAHPSGPVEVLVTGRRRSRPGIHVRRTNDLPPGDLWIVRGLLVTNPVRTALDLARELADPALERVVAEVLTREPGAAAELRERGTARLRDLVAGGPRRTRSENERRLLRIIREAGLPVPRTNAVVAGEEVDAYWAEHRLVVEVDAFFTHGDRVAFERDRRKRAALTARGIAVLAITDRRLEAQPLAVAATLAAALANTRRP